jgi:multicomponent Na+:H+ antiporter subunit B
VSAWSIVSINALLLGMMIVIAVAMARQRNLFVAAMMSSLFSLSTACLFVLLDAVDVAFTEAAVGAGISTVLILSALALTSYEDRRPRRAQHWQALLVCLAVGGLLLLAASEWPALGATGTPVMTHPLTAYFLEQSPNDTGLPNVVTSVLASYRGYDTLGEVTVVFTAGIAVMLLLWGRRPSKDASDET